MQLSWLLTLWSMCFLTKTCLVCRHFTSGNALHTADTGFFHYRSVEDLIQGCPWQCGSVHGPDGFSLRPTWLTDSILYSWHHQVMPSIWWSTIGHRVWVIEHGLTSPPTQYRLYGTQFCRSKDQPTVSKYWRNTESTQITEKYTKHAEIQKTQQIS